MNRITESPLVSVVIPTFNRGAVVGEAIASVRAQDYRPFELIVVDDGSTDETPELLGAFSEIRVLRQANRGVSAARNAGVAAARGEWVAFLDSDDLWLPGKLSAQVAYFAAHPQMSICQTEELWVRKGVRVNPGRRHRKRAGMIFEPSLELCLVSPSAVMLRRSLLEQVGPFDETLPACEDYDLWLRISSRHPVGLIDTPLIVKRGGHADQLSRLPGLDRYRIRALQKLIDDGGLSAAQRAAAIATLQRKCAVYAGGCRKRGRLAESRRYERLAHSYAATTLPGGDP